jgi:hypothetical protein
MTAPDNSPDDWDACRPGLLSGYAQRLHRRQLLRLAVMTGGTCAGVSALGFLIWEQYLRRLETEYQFFGLTCADVRELLPEYRSGRLDAQRSQILEKHVRRCPQCAHFRTELRDRVS